MGSGLERPEQLKDGRVLLRAFSLADVPDVTRACQDPEITRWTMIPSPYSDDDARTWIMGHEQMWASGTGAPFAIVGASDGHLIGSISLQAINHPNGTAVVGYWVAEWERGQGAATRALRLVADWAFEALGLGELTLQTILGNTASERVAEKAGFTSVGETTKLRHPSAPNRRLALKEWRRRAPSQWL